MQAITLDCGMQVALRRSARARRMVLRVSRSDGAAVLTLPARADLGEARAFVAGRAGWLRAAVAAAPGLQRVEAGAALPVAGRGLVLTPAAVRVCRVEEGRLLVPEGRPVGAIVAAWLQGQARAALAAACQGYVAALPRGARGMTALALRDTRSRWGSCTAEGRLMFNWRLAMAPPVVLDYVAAHEVAHLAHLDHSPAFWAQVARLHPGWEERRDWLRRNGPALQAWQFREA
ncbi:DUF45 domain-containing protein [Paracoccus sp. S-4012]|uniref:M48 family metallopeptidase n=1 Tax=Paracoccus sp. S-4012 TaxID=2665648 RepID=UPI0012AFE66C|nr:SprT family zinc-dependent metalloprotease [Paracoccus sp. S-4012]MRX51369.1 DUF45 domain-containing protein [Paracoccus sp. S-4012]